MLMTLISYGRSTRPRALTRFVLAGMLPVMLTGMCEAADVSAVPSVAPPTPPTCSVSGSPVVDFGSRSRGQLQSTTGGLTPGTRSLTVSAGCTLARGMKLRINALARGSNFSWSGTDSILRISARQGVLDGKAVQLQRLNAAGSPVGQPADTVTLAPDDTLVAMRDGNPAQGRQFGVTLNITPVTGEQDGRPVQRIYPEATLSITLVP